MINTTKAQRVALKRLYDSKVVVLNSRALVNPAKGRTPLTYREFRAQVKPAFGCIMVNWLGVRLEIEPDGYTHV